MGVKRKVGAVGGRVVLFFLFVGFLAGGVAGEIGDVEYVPSRDYAVVAEREINRAKSSVTVCLYRIASHRKGGRTQFISFVDIVYLDG
jgi:hypothetical protein